MKKIIQIGLLMLISPLCQGQGPFVKPKEFSVNGMYENTQYSVWMKYFTVENKTIFYLVEKNEVIDSLCISGVRGIETIERKANSFIDMKSIVRGGSGVSLRRETYLCVSKGRLYKCLDLTSDLVSQLNEVYDHKADSAKLFDEKEDYHLLLSIKKLDGDYKIILLESIIIVSKNQPTNNLAVKKSYELSFDKRQMIFYNSMHYLTGPYAVASREGNYKTNKIFNSTVFGIQLFDTTYSMIDKDWYEGDVSGAFLTILN